MGYTHYYNFKKGYKPSAEDFSEAVELFKKQLDKIPETFTNPCYGKCSKKDLLFGWDGNGTPEITDSKILFNGNDAKGLSHESFLLTPDCNKFNFCKTARKPYDIAVCLCLLSFKEVFGDSFVVGSDGIMRENFEACKDEWQEEWGECKVEAEWQVAYDIWDKE